MRFWNSLIALCLILSAGLGLVVPAGGALTSFAPAQWAGQQSAAAMFANLLGENRGR